MLETTQAAETAQGNPAHKPSSGDFFPTLDGLRGFAVLSVVIYHSLYFNYHSTLQCVVYCLTRGGAMGVQVFFVLSGFLISHSVFKTVDRFDLVSYSSRRFYKIAPPFLLSILISAFFYCLWNKPTGVVVTMLAIATTYRHFSEGWPFSGWVDLNTVYWTLFIEIHFYILLPLLYFSLRRITRHPQWGTFLIFLILPPIVRVTTYLPLSTYYFSWTFRANLFPRAFDLFALGILFAIIYQDRHRKSALISRSHLLATSGALLLAATFLGFAALSWWKLQHQIGQQPSIWEFETFRYLPAISTFLPLFSIFEPSTHFLARALTWTPLSFCGLISYEWYLFHVPPEQFLMHIIGSASGSILIYLSKTLFPIAGTFLLSVMVYFLYSAPILAWAKRRLQSRRRLTSPPRLDQVETTTPV